MSRLRLKWLLHLFLACNFPGFIRKHWKIRWGRGPYEQGGKIESTYCQNFAKCTVHLDVACLNQISCPQTSGMESHILPFNVAKCRGVTQSFNGKFNINISHNIRIKVIVKVSWSDRFLSIKFEQGCLFLKREGYNMSHRELFKEVTHSCRYRAVAAKKEKLFLGYWLPSSYRGWARKEQMDQWTFCSTPWNFKAIILLFLTSSYSWIGNYRGSSWLLSMAGTETSTT